MLEFESMDFEKSITKKERKCPDCYIQVEEDLSCVYI